jgi:hypothetical protein
MPTSLDFEEKRALEDTKTAHQDHPPRTSTQETLSLDPEIQETDTHDDAEPALPPPPDGGLHAWLKVFGGFLIYINIWYNFFLSLSLSSYWPNFSQGLHPNLRRIPSVLQIRSALLFLSVRHIMDRYRAGLAPHHRWRTLGSVI